MKREKPDIHVNIDQLILEGYKPWERYEFADGMQAELGRLFSGEGVSRRGRLLAGRPVVQAGEIHGGRLEGPRAMGVQTARAVYSRFR